MLTKLFDRKEAIEMLGISMRTLDTLIADRAIGCVRIGNGKKNRVLFRQADLDLFIASNAVEPRPRNLGAMAAA